MNQPPQELHLDVEPAPGPLPGNHQKGGLSPFGRTLVLRRSLAQRRPRWPGKAARRS
jgi:hypothetical protein